MSSHFKMSAFFISLLLILSLSSHGCTPNQAEIEKKILEYDPSFQKFLDKKNALLDELNQQKALFLKRQQEIDCRIKSLQKEKKQLEKEYLSFKDKIKRKTQPEKRNFQKNLIELEYNYKQKEQSLRSIDRDIKEINSLIKKKDALELTQEEMRTWGDRLASLTKKKEAISLEKDKLKEEIRITKLKIKVFS